jgi:PAS domain S-box-containing protein
MIGASSVTLRHMPGYSGWAKELFRTGMNVPARITLSVSSAVGPAVLLALLGGALLTHGRADYPQLHTIFDTGVWLLSAVLAVSLWELGARSKDALLTLLAVTFAVTSMLELVHALLSAEWSRTLAWVTRSEGLLRPASWPPAAYSLPIGVACSLWVARARRRSVSGFAAALLIASVALLALFYWLPRYTEPGLLGITRPNLSPVPLLWTAIGVVCWHRRSQHRVLPALACAAAVLALAHIAMLYSRAPHDTTAMIAHLGKLCGYLTLLLWLVQTASRDAAERQRAEQALATSHATLEERVRERTAELQSANAALQVEITSRREAEFALRDSHLRTRAVFETALDAVITIDDSGRITEFNAAAERIFGYRRTELIGRHLDEAIIPPELRESHRRGFARYLSTGEATVLGKRLELPGMRADGSRIVVELSINRMPGSGPPMFAAFLRDITARQEAEAALRESQARFQMLAESLPQLVWTCLADGHCDYLSRQWVEYTGRPEADQLGYGWAEQLHPEDRDRVQHEWAQATVRGDSFDVEFRIRRADGVYRWFKTRAVPLRDGAGRIVKWFGSNTDFDDFKRSDDRLRAQLARLDLLDRTTRAIGERQDLRSIFQVVLERLEEHLAIDFGCACLSTAGRDTLSVACIGAKSLQLGPKVALSEQTAIDVDQNGLARCLRGELVYEPDISASPFPFPAQLAQGGLRALVIAPLLVERNVFGCMIAARVEAASFTSAECEFLRQLSEHVALAAHQAQLYGALQTAYEDLRQTQQTVMQQERLRALGQMASGIAHDINNALSPAALYVESLLTQGPHVTGQKREYLEVIQRAIDGVAHTVSRMREFYRPRERELILAPVDLNEILTHVRDLTRARWQDMPQERGVVIRMDTDFARNLPPIMAAESEIRDALTNLVLNAVDAMPEGGTITLRSRVTPGVEGAQRRASSPSRVQIEVCDTGVGMSAETRSRCLEPFFTTKGERGTGLGLAMVYGMVQRHSADLEIDSEIGSGTTMRLIFAVAAAIPARRTDGHQRPIEPLRILVVDDDPLLLTSLRDIFEQDGHIVTVADGGQAGIDAFAAAERQGERFAVVITDLGMPHVDGRTVAAAVKSCSLATPVILLTGWGHRLAAEAEIPAHVDRLVSKPPKLTELRAALAEVTGQALATRSQRAVS